MHCGVAIDLPVLYVHINLRHTSRMTIHNSITYRMSTYPKFRILLLYKLIDVFILFSKFVSVQAN